MLRLKTHLAIAWVFGAISVATLVLAAHFREDARWIGIWWTPETTDATREAAERTLGLIGEGHRRDEFRYRLRDTSVSSLSAIVDHPLVRLTRNIDRRNLRLVINAPALPAAYRRLLEDGRGAWVTIVAAALAVIVLASSVRTLRTARWPSGRELAAPATVVILLSVYAVEIARTAWIGDDTAITLRSVLNFINGYGARFNIDERVQAYTHPLWFLCISGVSWISNNVFTSTLWLSVACSLGTMWLLLRARQSLVTAVIVASGVMLSKAYVDYSASGLENPLAHIIVLATTMAALGFAADPQERLLTGACLGVSGAYLTRPDLVLLVAPVVMLAILRQRPPVRVIVRCAVTGALPAIAWTAVGTYYYGTPFPNPAYAKLGAGVPFNERLARGEQYFLHSVPRDPITLVMIALGIAVGLFGGAAPSAVAAGIVAYLTFVIAIGGDFMEGRFLTAPLVLAAYLLVRRPQGRLMTATLAACVVLFGMVGADKTLLSPASYADETIPPDGITDERGYYFQDYGWINANNEIFRELDWKIDPDDLNEVLVNCGGLGYASIMDGPAVHYVDTCGLADPLLARLPSRRDPDSRIGHFARSLPAGYKESIRARKNLLEDPALHAYYELIRIVTRADLNDPRRLLMIWRLNAERRPGA